MASSDEDFEPPGKRFKHSDIGETCAPNVQSFKCTVEGCGRCYSRADTLTVHMRTAHDKTVVQKTSRFSCPVAQCSKTFFHATQLINHLSDHKINVVTDCLEFPDWNAFLHWKEREETETFTCYTKPKGSICSKNGEGTSSTVLYTCCRDGRAKENLLPKKTTQTRKHRLSRKLEGYCISRMTVTRREDGKVSAKYIRTHTHHTPGIGEAKHLPLSQGVKQKVREKYGQNVKLDSILDDIRGNLPSRENRESFLSEASRASFITRQDARNIVRSLDNAVKHRHDNDALSVDRLCRELKAEKECVVIAYKPQGMKDEGFPYLCEDSFLLVIMTKFQMSMFEKHSQRVVCIDSTHKTNPYGFKLVTVVVPDEFKNGIPIAWGIVDKEDVPTLEAMFKSIHDHVPTALVNTLMTDDDPALPVAFRNIFTNTTHLLCRWHIDRAWQRKLYSMVQNADSRTELYHSLWLLISSPDPEKFQLHLQHIQTTWSDREPKFIEYFKSAYASRAEKWALCYRHFDHSGVDTNMLVESFHNKLKNHPRYLDNKLNRRLDDLIHILLKYECDMFMAQQTKQVMKSPWDASMKLEGDRHQNGLKIDSTDVQEREGKYIVKASDGTSTYDVTLCTTQCPAQSTCVPQCTTSECMYLCRHLITCTCWDYQEGHLCKHCHKVRSIAGGACNDSDNQRSIDDPGSLAYTVNPHVSNRDHTATLIDAKRSAVQVAAERVQSLSKAITDTHILEHALATLSTLASSLKANIPMQCNENSNQPTSFSTVDNFAPAQKNEVQLCFKRTTNSAGRKQKMVPLVPPTAEEEERLMRKMKPSITQQSGETLPHPVMPKPTTKHQSVPIRKKRCGQCHGCTLPDCAKCSYCKDMRKFGGPGRKKKGCIQRKCTFYENEKHTLYPPSQQPLSQLTPSQDPPSQPSSSYSPTLPQLPSPQPQHSIVSSLTSLTKPPQLRLQSQGSLCAIASTSRTAAVLTPLSSLQSYLEQQGRKVRRSRGDGNCLFRSFSFQLLGTEEEHIAVRTLAIRFQNLNKSAFTPYLTAINKPTMTEHIAHVQQPDVYGTHVEILALATFFNIPVFYCCLSGRQQQYKWHCVPPLKHVEHALRCPDLAGSPLQHISPPTHFELSYMHNIHYDSIVSTTGELCSDLPKLSEEETHVAQVI